MIQRIATANIVQMTEEMNPEGLPIGGFRITLFHVPSPEAEPVFVGAGDVNPLEEGGSDNLGFNIYSPGGYYAECTRLTAMGQPIGPVATSTTRYVGDGTATFQAPLVITLGISSVPA